LSKWYRATAHHKLTVTAHTPPPPTAAALAEADALMRVSHASLQAFSISTGHPDWIAVGIEEYGVTSFNGTDAGSRWNVWIGKKDRTPGASFLDRNGLAPNCGRVYVYVADDQTTVRTGCSQLASQLQ
jgi:hypothetical protein